MGLKYADEKLTLLATELLTASDESPSNAQTNSVFAFSFS